MSFLRVAVLCDYAEENWPSMERAASLLVDRLHAADPGVHPTRIQPRMSRPFQNGMRRAGWGARTGFNADRLLNRFWCYPRLVKELPRFDLFHVVDHSYAQLVHQLPPDRTIVTCHDLDTFRCLYQPRAERRPYWFRAMTRHTLGGLRKAAAVVCVSNATREQILQNGILPAERVHVVLNAIDPRFDPLPDREWDAAAERVLGPAGDTIDLLHVGSTIPRKRIDILLRVFAACLSRNPQLRLIRVGAPFTASQLGLLRDLRLEQAVLCLPVVREELLAALYRRASLVLVPSESEGFGLPLAEAMACGTPVIASDIPALREIGGGAATLCRVGDLEQWTSAVAGLLEEKRIGGNGWRATIAAGCARAFDFTWERNAAAMIAVYRNMPRVNGLGI